MIKWLVTALLAVTSLSSLAQEFRMASVMSYQASSNSLTAAYVDLAVVYQSEKTFGITARDLKLRQGDWSASGVQVGIETTLKTSLGEVTESLQITTVSNKTFGTGKITSSLLFSPAAKVDLILDRSFVMTQEAIKAGVTTYTLAGGALTALLTPNIAVSGYVAGQYFSDENLRGHISLSAQRIGDLNLALKYQSYYNTENSDLYYNPSSWHQVTLGASLSKRVSSWAVQASVNAGVQRAAELAKPAYDGAVHITSPPLRGIVLRLSTSISFEGARTYQRDGEMKLGYRTSAISLLLSIPLS